MIALLPFLLLACPAAQPTLVASAAASPMHAPPSFRTAQEPAAATPEQDAEPSKPEKKKFARLSSPDKKLVQAGLYAIEKEEKQEKIDAGIAQLIQVGEAAIPMCLDAATRMETAKRLDPLWATLNAILVDDDLALAWKGLKKKAPESARVYLARRYADSSRKDAATFLEPLLASESSAIAYEAARGLVFRAQTESLGKIEAEISTRWLKEAAMFRADFAAVNRAPLSASVLPFLRRPRLKEKLAALRMFELFGLKEHAPSIMSFLSESDTSLRLAAINACRVVVAKEEPLDNPSMTEIIERAEAWKAKL